MSGAFTVRLTTGRGGTEPSAITRDQGDVMAEKQPMIVYAATYLSVSAAETDLKIFRK